MCQVYEESYAGIQVFNKNTGSMCMRCRREGTYHNFLAQNHMDPRLQPRVLEVLRQVEEMLITQHVDNTNIEDTPLIFFKRLRMFP